MGADELSIQGPSEIAHLTDRRGVLGVGAGGTLHLGSVENSLMTSNPDYDCMGVSKNKGKTPKMDGENDDLGVPLFLEKPVSHPYSLFGSLQYRGL